MNSLSATPLTGTGRASRNTSASGPGDRKYTEKLASYSAGLKFEALPKDVVERAKLCVLDTIGISLAAASSELGRAVARAASRFEQEKLATIFGAGCKVSPASAAMANGTLSDILELQDGWRLGGIHPSVVIAAALATAEWRALSGRALIVAIVAGYEVANRVAGAAHPHHMARGYMPNGTAGTIGSAAGVARLLEFDAKKTAGALGVAGFLLPVSTAENLWEGYSAKPLHTGYAAKVGLESALLAEDGFYGCPIEGSPSRGRGFLEITTGPLPLERMVEGLGESFTIRDVYYKFYPICRMSQAPVEAALNIARTAAYAPEQIRRITVSTYEHAANLLTRYLDRDSSMSAAQFSLPYVLAAALTDHAFGTAQLSAARRHDEGILELAGRVEVAIDPAMTARYPHTTPARVEVALEDGRVLSHEVEMPRGDPRVPLKDSELYDKFDQLCSDVTDRATAQHLREAILGLENVKNVNELMALIGSIRVE